MERILSVILVSLMILSMLPAIAAVAPAAASPVFTINAATKEINGANWRDWVVSGSGTQADPYVLNISGTSVDYIIKFTNFINTTGIWFLIENATLSTNDWTIIDIEGNISGVNLIVRNTTLQSAYIGVFFKNAHDITVVLENVTAIDVSVDILGWGNSWAGLFDTDDNVTNIVMKGIDIKFRGDSGSPYALVNVQDKTTVGELSIYLEGIDTSVSPNWLTYFVVINDGHITSFTLKDSYLGQYSQTSGAGLIYFNGAYQVDNVLVENVVADKMYNPWHTAHLVHFAGTAVTGGNVTIRNCVLVGVEDVFHVSGSAAGSTFDTITIEKVTVSALRYDNNYGRPRYIVGLSGSITASKVLLDHIVSYNLSSLVASGNEQHIGRLVIENSYLYNTSKIISLGVDTNRIQYFEMSNVTAVYFKDGFDIRGVSSGYFHDLNLTIGQYAGQVDGWVDANGFYLANVNNTVFENILFWGAAWEEFILDSGKFYNITISHVTVEEYPGMNGQNPAVAIGRWGTAEVHGLTIEYSTFKDSSVLLQYGTDDLVDDLRILNVTAIGSDPDGWEGSNAVIKLVKAQNIYFSGLKILSPQKQYGVQLSGVTGGVITLSNFSEVPGYAIYAESSVSGVEVHNCTFWKNGNKPQVYSDAPNSTGIKAYYNLYTDHISTDNDNDGIADTPYHWAGSGGVVDPKPIYYPVGIAYVIINDTTLASNTYGVVTGGTGTASDPYVVELNAPSVPSTFLYGVLIDNVSVYVKVTGTVGGSMSEAAVYVGSNITGFLNITGLTVTGSSKHGIHIHGLNGHLELHSISISGVGGQALFFDQASNIVADTVTIDMGGAGWDGLHFEYSSHITVSHVTISNAQYKGVYIQSSSYITITDATITGCSDYSIYLTGSTDDHITLSHVSVTGGTRLLYADASTISYLKVTDFTGTSPAWDGIYVEGSNLQNAWFEDITLSKVAWKTFYLQGRGSNITIKDYTFDGTGGTYAHHAALAIDGAAAHDYSGITIENVHITSASPDDWGDWGTGAIYVVKADHVVIKGVVVTGTAGGSGIAVFIRECNDVSIEDSSLTNNAVKPSTIAGALTVMYTDGLTVKNTTVAGSTNGGRGVVLLGVTNILLDHVVVKDNAYHGIVTYGAVNMVVRFSTISGNAGKGLGIYWSGALAQYPENIQILNNTFKQNGLNAIYIQSGYQGNTPGGPSHILIKYNVFEKNGYKATSVADGYAVWIGYNCTDVNVTWNDFLWNRNNKLDNGYSQAYAASTLFDYNFWSEAGFINIHDEDGDGILDQPYYIDGPGADADYHARTTSLAGAPLPTPEPPLLPILLLAALLALIVIKKRK